MSILVRFLLVKLLLKLLSAFKAQNWCDYLFLGNLLCSDMFAIISHLCSAIDMSSILVNSNCFDICIILWISYAHLSHISFRLLHLRSYWSLWMWCCPHFAQIWSMCSCGIWASNFHQTYIVGKPWQTDKWPIFSKVS